MTSLLLRSLVLLAISLNRSCTQSGDNTVTEEGSGLVENDVEFLYHKAEFEGLSIMIVTVVHILPAESVCNNRKVLEKFSVS